MKSLPVKNDLSTTCYFLGMLNHMPAPAPPSFPPLTVDPQRYPCFGAAVTSLDCILITEESGGYGSLRSRRGGEDLGEIECSGEERRGRMEEAGKERQVSGKKWGIAVSQTNR